jgi:hypothetical protein
VLLLGALFVVGLAYSPRGHVLLIGLWIGIPLVFSLTVVSHRAADPRYSVFIVPLYLLVLARGTMAVVSAMHRLIAPIFHRRDWLAPTTTMVAVLAVAALGVAPLREYYLDRAREDWRASAQYLVENLAPGDIVLIDGASYGAGRDSRRVETGLQRYLPDEYLTGDTLLRVERGLWQNVERSLEGGPGRVWAVLWYSAIAPSWEGQEHPNIVDFLGMLIIRPMEPSGDLYRDTVSMLHVLHDLMPGEEGRFEVHLALADIHTRTLRLEDAQSELEKASSVQPDDPRAPRALSQSLADFERISSAMQDIEHLHWHNLGQELALAGYGLDPTPASPGDSLHLTLWWGALQSMDRDYTAFVHVLGPDGQFLVQEDRLLKHGSLSTSRWRLGSVPVRDEYVLPLPTDSEHGQYTVTVGVYYWETGERLPAWDELGQRVYGDAIPLGELAVVE